MFSLRCSLSIWPLPVTRLPEMLDIKIEFLENNIKLEAADGGYEIEIEDNKLDIKVEAEEEEEEASGDYEYETSDATTTVEGSGDLDVETTTSFTVEEPVTTV